jgi:hypothetical protein
MSLTPGVSYPVAPTYRRREGIKIIPLRYRSHKFEAIARRFSKNGQTAFLTENLGRLGWGASLRP